MKYSVSNYDGTTFASDRHVVFDSLYEREAVEWVEAIVAGNDVTRMTGCIGLDFAISYRSKRDGVERMWYFEATDDYMDGTTIYGQHAIV